MTFNQKDFVPTGVILGISHAIEHLKQWAYLEYNLHTLPTTGMPRGINTWRFSKEQNQRGLIDVWVGLEILTEQKIVNLLAIVGDKEIKEPINYERWDPRGDQTKVIDTLNDFKNFLSEVFRVQYELKQVNVKTIQTEDIIKIKRLRKIPAERLMEVTFYLENKHSITMLMDEEAANGVNKNDVFTYIDGKYSFYPHKNFN